MSESLFWFINNQTCPADGTHLGKPTKRLRSHSGDLKLGVWTCPLCKRDFVEYTTGYDVLRRFPEIRCRFLDLDIPIVNQRKLVEMNNETQIIGQKVNHISFGEGIVTLFPGNWIDIHFDSEQRDIRFVYPDAFGEFLVFQDTTVQNLARSAILEKSNIGKENSAKNNPKTDVNIQASVNNRNQERTKSKKQRKIRLNNYYGIVMPSSAILRVTISKDEKKYFFVITDDLSQQDTEHGIYCKTHELSRRVIDAYLGEDNQISINGETYDIVSFEQFAKYDADLDEWVKPAKKKGQGQILDDRTLPEESFPYQETTTIPFFNAPDETDSVYEAHDLYIFKQKGIFSGTYELVDVIMFFPEKGQSLKVTVYYQPSTSRFFMNEASYLPLEKAHGRPNVIIHYPQASSEQPMPGGNFQEQSKLRKLGYNVQQTEGMTEEERQRLLESIIRSGKMTDAEVANHLEMLISLNLGKPNMADACSYWSSDLRFVYKSFGDLRKQMDWCSAKPSQGKKTSKKSDQSTNEVDNTQNEDDYPRPKKADADADRLEELEKLQRIKEKELKAAVGLLRIFKRLRIKREIKQIEWQISHIRGN